MLTLPVLSNNPTDWSSYTAPQSTSCLLLYKDYTSSDVANTVMVMASRLADGTIKECSSTDLLS